MSNRFPSVTAKQVVRILEKVGFIFARQTGSSHAIYKRHTDNKRTVVPIHATVTLKRRTLKSIMEDAGLSVEEFKKLL